MKLIPYIHIDGVPTFRDSQITGLYHRMEQDGTVDTVFYDGGIASAEEFLLFVKMPANRFFIVMPNNQDMAAFFWLNTINGKSAQYHGCAFREYWGRLEEIARYSVETLLNMKVDDDFVYDVLYTFPPQNNPFACRFDEKIGAAFGGSIENYAWIASEGKSCGVNIYYFTREIINESL